MKGRVSRRRHLLSTLREKLARQIEMCLCTHECRAAEREDVRRVVRAHAARRSRVSSRRARRAPRRRSRRRAGCVRRRPRRGELDEVMLAYPVCSRSRLSRRARASRAERAADAAHHDRVGAHARRAPTSIRARDREEFFHRPRDRRRHRRDFANRCEREALSRRHARRGLSIPRDESGRAIRGTNATRPWKTASPSTRTRQCSAARPCSAKRASSAAPYF